MINENYNLNYIETYTLLKEIHTLSNGRIPCLPKIKIIQDGLIVGIITETNQTVLLKEPEINSYEDDLYSDEINILEDEINRQLFTSKKRKIT